MRGANESGAPLLPRASAPARSRWAIEEPGTPLHQVERKHDFFAALDQIAAELDVFERGAGDQVNGRVKPQRFFDGMIERLAAFGFARLE